MPCSDYVVLKFMADMHVEQNSHFHAAAQAAGDGFVHAVGQKIGNIVDMIGQSLDNLTARAGEMLENAAAKVSDVASAAMTKMESLVPNRLKAPPKKSSPKQEIAQDIAPPKPSLSEHHAVNTQLALADITLPDMKMVDMDLGQHSVAPTHSRAAGMSGPQIGMSVNT